MEKEYMTDSKGHLVPISKVKGEDLLEDQLVKGVMDFAVELNAQIKRFKEHTFDDINAFLKLIDEKYNVKKGGKKGNMSFMSYDGLSKMQVAISDHITFGAQLQTAKSLIDECIIEWSQGSNDNIKALVDHAFQVDKEGKVNKEALFGLRRLNITDEKWLSAMQAITDSVRIEGSKSYIRFYKRETTETAWQAVTIDLANA